MSLLLMESCDLASVSGAGSKWTDITSVTFNATRDGRTCWQGAGVLAANLTKVFPDDEHATIIVGMRIYMPTFLVNAARIIRFYEGESTSGTFHGYLDHDATGRLIYYRGDGTALASGSVGDISTATWHYVECKVTISDTVGAVVVNVDNVEVINASGLDTRNGGTDGLIDCITLAEGSNGLNWRDIVIMNGAGSTLNDIIGPMVVEAKLPTGVGDLAGWTPSAGANWQNVDDDPTPDGDTTYNESSAAGDRDTFPVETLTAITDPLAVQAHVVGRYDASPLKIGTTLRRSSTNDDGTAETPTGTHRSAAVTIWETDPIAAAAWTTANFNLTEFGYFSEAV